MSVWGDDVDWESRDQGSRDEETGDLRECVMKESDDGNFDEVRNRDLALDPRDGDADGVVDPDSRT